MSVEARIAGLEARVAALESKAGASATAHDGGATPGEALADEMLDRDWANRTIDKDPKRWTGASCIGLAMSDAPAEWHDSAAGFFDWKAQKGREESPPKLQTTGKNAGKPWHERDAFNAKLHRAWARRIRARGQSRPAHVPPAMVDDPYAGRSDADEGLPFAVPFDVESRHLRRRRLVDRW